MAVAMVCALAAGCAGAPRVTAPDRSGVWGYLRLVPREGVAVPGTAGAGAPYGDRRYADIELVDYTRPGFAVVYLDGRAPAGAPLELAIHSGLGGVRIQPPNAVLAVGGQVRVRNATAEDRVLTCPAAGLVRHLAPGEEAAFAAPGPGALDLFVPGEDGPRAGHATVFAAPGPWARVDGVGRYEIVDVAPGARRVHAWHPRFPPAVREVQLGPGVATRVDLELGVGLDALDGEAGHAD